MTEREFTDKQKEGLTKIHEIFTSGLREQLNVPNDWTYFSDFATLKNYEGLIDIIQLENITAVSDIQFTEKVAKELRDEDVSNASEDPLVKFTWFVSPAGIQNAKNHASKNGYN